MRNNLANKGMRNADVGHIYVQLSASSASPVEVKRNHLIRIRAGAASCTVSVEMPGGTPTDVYGDGKLIPMRASLTLAANEVATLNVGDGVPPVYDSAPRADQDLRERRTVTVSFSSSIFSVAEAQEYQVVE
jgi:hypothetical protein